MEQRRADEQFEDGTTLGSHSGRIVHSEALHLRNFDHHRSHDVEVTLRNEHGETSFRDRYHLSPGKLESEFVTIPAGTYVVAVDCGNEKRERQRCQLGNRPDETAIIELGNGVISITEGIGGTA